MTRTHYSDKLRFVTYCVSQVPESNSAMVITYGGDLALVTLKNSTRNITSGSAMS